MIKIINEKNLSVNQINIKEENINEKIKTKIYSNWEKVDIDIIVKSINKIEIENLVIEIKKQIQNFKWDFNLNLELDEDKEFDFIYLLSQALYSFDKYKNKKSKIYKLYYKTKKDYNLFIENLYFIKDLINEPSNVINPQSFEEIVKKVIKKVKIKVIKWKELEEMWFWWILAVWKWSEYEPRLIIIEYKPIEKKEYEIWLIGKWVCFDSWWYNIKPTWAIEDMKMDMSWAAVVLWIIKYLSEINYNKNIVVGIPLVENLVSWRSYKPWDVIKIYWWKTVEIINTDAEWRLILADTLAYIENKYNPNYLIDFATLTWAQIISLWQKFAAIIWKNHTLNQKIQKLSMDIAEKAFELPYYEWYMEKYKSEIADITNAYTSRYEPWCILGWLFLWYFIKNKNFVHFDIAWPAMMWYPQAIYWKYWTWFWFYLFLRILEKEILS